MEQIVYLDPDDDIRTIRDRLEWAEAPRVLLVVPRGHRPLRSAVNMRLLARQGSFVGREVILVTRDRAVTESARHEGLAAFATIEQGQKARSRHLTSFSLGKADVASPVYSLTTQPIPRCPMV